MELLPEDVKSNIYRAKHEMEYSTVIEELEGCFLQAKMNNLVVKLQPHAPRNGYIKLNLNIHSVRCSSAEILQAVKRNVFPFKDKLPIVYNKHKRFQQKLKHKSTSKVNHRVQTRHT